MWMVFKNNSMCLIHWDPDSEQSGHSEEGGHSVAANSRKCSWTRGACGGQSRFSRGLQLLQGAPSRVTETENHLPCRPSPALKTNEDRAGEKR